MDLNVKLQFEVKIKGLAKVCKAIVIMAPPLLLAAKPVIALLVDHVSQI